MYEVNKVKLCFHVDIHVYIKYYTLKMHLNYSHYAEVKQKWGYMNVDIFVVYSSLFLWHATVCFNDSDAISAQ